jgi:hypothetical protein
VTYVKFISVFNYGHDLLMINQWENVESLNCPIPTEQLNTTLFDYSTILDRTTLSTTRFTSRYTDYITYYTDYITSTTNMTTTTTPILTTTTTSPMTTTTTMPMMTTANQRPIYCIQNGTEILEDLKISSVRDKCFSLKKKI